MRKLLLKKITGFEIINPNNPVIIRDEMGRVFYTTEGFTPKIKTFNLPKNVLLFVDTGSIRELRNPIEFKLFRLPKRERYANPDPTNFKLSGGYNCAKASVNWNTKEINIDQSMLEKGLPTATFLFYHECGHRYYKSEHLADLYAVNCMLLNGYNPSQIGMILIKTLSERQQKRKQFIIKKLMPYVSK